MEPPSPFKRLAVDPASPQKDNESEDSDNYDINDLVLTPTPVKKESNERRAKALPDDDDEGEPMLPSLSLSRISEGKSGNSTQSIDENVIEGKTIVEPGYAPSSITFEPSPRASTTRWVKLRLISLLTRPFRTNKIETKTRSFSGDSNVSSRASLGSLDFEADVDNSNAANSSSTSLGLRSIVPGTMRSKTKNKKRKSSLIEIAKMAEQRHKEEFEFEELQNSVGQFRNPMFEAGSSMGNSSMVKSGIYAAKKRLRRHSIVPGDVIKFSKETTETISYETKTQPDVREKPTNIWDWVIDCDSRLYQRFYLLIVFLILAEACVLPYQFVFYEKGGTEPAPYAYKVYHFLVTGFYILDFYVSLHLTFVDKKSETVIDLTMIGDHYIQSLRFKIDSVCAIPFDLFGLFMDVWWWATYIKLLKSFRLLNLIRLKRLSDNQTVINVGRIVWVLVLFVVTMHIMACMWYQLSFYEEKYLSDNHSWMRHKLEGIVQAQSWDEGLGIITEDATLQDYTCTDFDSNKGVKLVSTNQCFTQFRQYLLSLYAVMMILMQDGIEPTTEIECLFAIIFGLFGMVVGAVLVGQTADIIGNLHRSETRYRNKLDDVTEQLRNLEISAKTRKRVFEYLDFIWTVNKGLNRERILGELSVNLKSEVLVSVHGDVIRKIPFFDIDEIPELLVHVVQLLKSSYYLPGDVIVHEHEKTVDTSCMHFIVSGKVAAYHMREPNTILQYMYKGDFFGEIAYLARGARRTASICAAKNSDIASLMFSDVDKLIKIFPEMKNRMEEELKKHMAFTEEGRKYIKAATRMEKVQVGSVLLHETRGEGIVIKIDDHKRRHVQYKNGEVHKYLPTSWHKIKLMKEGNGAINGANVWDDIGSSKKIELPRSHTDGSAPIEASKESSVTKRGLAMGFARNFVARHRATKVGGHAPSPFKINKNFEIGDN